MGIENTNENVFHCLVNLLIRRWKSLGNIFQVVCTNPVGGTQDRVNQEHIIQDYGKYIKILKRMYKEILRK